MKNKSPAKMPPVMILCGGQGTRLRDVTELLPKPMVPIGEQPIVWHIMKSYAAFGVTRFILCLGYKREDFIDYFLNYHARSADITVRLGREHDITYHDHTGEENWEVTLANTGPDTMTGGRVRIAARYLEPDDEFFFLTYGDAVGDVAIDELLEFHRAAGKLLTISAVNPVSRFGELSLVDDVVQGFREKPPGGDKYINGGFMVMDRRFIHKYIPPKKDLFLEAAPMTNAAANSDIAAYRHHGFWQCMDTPREHQLLNELWKKGDTPWTKYWERNV